MTQQKLSKTYGKKDRQLTGRGLYITAKLIRFTREGIYICDIQIIFLKKPDPATHWYALKIYVWKEIGLKLRFEGDCSELEAKCCFQRQSWTGVWDKLQFPCEISRCGKALISIFQLFSVSVGGFWIWGGLGAGL